ncbi:MAG: transcriptional repressor [Anaerolineae bacterium]|nr:transcriptional repressor [Anaerolineae bacterium]MCB9133139.1 transcriptional repressor [Anaerolineales bacterium]MCB0233979.1 transcriptional repressor [Anaerolineae bacterium]MCB0246495.1 transcriptional repressor [Anaerolineae bacterium]MCB0251562.1 transcriptional repressor [Anaerolineae bacterium]
MEQNVTERMQLAGYKLTPPRLAVLQVLDETDEHLSRAQILERVQAVQPAIGRATVYRTLELLIRLGVVRPIYLGEQNVCFTRADRGHHHLICSECGQVVEFDECTVGQLQETLAQRLNFDIRGHLLEFYGLCERCQG